MPISGHPPPGLTRSDKEWIEGLFDRKLASELEPLKEALAVLLLSQPHIKAEKVVQSLLGKEKADSQVQTQAQTKRETL